MMTFNHVLKKCLTFRLKESIYVNHSTDTLERGAENEGNKSTCLCRHIVIFSLLRRFFLMRRLWLSLPVPKRVPDE